MYRYSSTISGDELITLVTNSENQLSFWQSQAWFKLTTSGGRWSQNMKCTLAPCFLIFHPNDMVQEGPHPQLSLLVYALSMYRFRKIRFSPTLEKTIIATNNIIMRCSHSKKNLMFYHCNFLRNMGRSPELSCTSWCHVEVAGHLNMTGWWFGTMEFYDFP